MGDRKPSPWALKRAYACIANIKFMWLPEGVSDVEFAARALDAAYLAGERRGRERAAEVADAGAEAMDTPSQIARTIRNLPDEEPA